MKLKLVFGLAAVALLAGCATGDPRYSRDTLYLTEDGGIVAVPHSNRVTARPETGRASFDNVSYWDGDGVAGAPFVLIRLSEQRVYFYKGKELVGVSAISTGREGYNTPTGKFKIVQKSKDHVSSLYGNYVDAVTGEIVKENVDTRRDPKPKGARYDGAKMPYFMRFAGGYGMHAGFLPGYPASHGCIRMPEFMAEAFFNNVSLKTPIEIVP